MSSLNLTCGLLVQSTSCGGGTRAHALSFSNGKSLPKKLRTLWIRPPFQA